MVPRSLFLGAHTDDVDLSCGATIAAYASNKYEPMVQVLSDCGSAVLREECSNSFAVLGVGKDRQIINTWPVRMFASNRDEIREYLHTLSGLGWHSVFIPSADDVHQDHHVLHEEAIRVFLHQSLSIYEYESPWNTIDFHPNVFQSVGQIHIEQKVQALLCYTSQKHRPYMSEEFIRGWARMRGLQSSGENFFAEAFRAVKVLL